MVKSPINDYDKQIKTICKRFYEANQSHKIEYEDLYQEAYLKLCELPLNKPKGYILRSIVNHLIDYCKHWNYDPLSTAITLEDLYKY